MTKADIAEYLAANVQGVGSREYELKRYMKMTKPMLEALLDEATAPNAADREKARAAFYGSQQTRVVARMRRGDRTHR